MFTTLSSTQIAGSYNVTLSGGGSVSGIFDAPMLIPE